MKDTTEEVGARQSGGCTARAERGNGTAIANSSVIRVEGSRASTRFGRATEEKERILLGV